jgi:hypothetical protein
MRTPGAEASPPSSGALTESNTPDSSGSSAPDSVEPSTPDAVESSTPDAVEPAGGSSPFTSDDTPTKPSPGAATKPAQDDGPSAVPTEPATADAERDANASRSASTPPPRVRRGDPAVGASSHAVVKRAYPKPATRFEHAGVTGAIRLGTSGCFRTVCGSDRHDASPGFRIDGFLGHNFRGWLDLGVAGGWGTMGANVAEGTNVLALYGVDAAALAQMSAALGNPLGFDPASMRVQDAKLRMARVGPSLRLHFVPRGRFAAYVGSGAGYSLFRGRYETAGGAVRMSFHGVDVPVEAGFAVHLTPNVALGAQVDYLWARYVVTTLDHPAQSLTAPVRLLDEIARTTGGALLQDLPQYWSAGVLLRARI